MSAQPESERRRFFEETDRSDCFVLELPAGYPAPELGGLGPMGGRIVRVYFPTRPPELAFAAPADPAAPRPSPDRPRD